MVRDMQEALLLGEDSNKEGKSRSGPLGRYHSLNQEEDMEEEEMEGGRCRASMRLLETNFDATLDDIDEFLEDDLQAEVRRGYRVEVGSRGEEGVAEC